MKTTTPRAQGAGLPRVLLIIGSAGAALSAGGCGPRAGTDSGETINDSGGAFTDSGPGATDSGAPACGTEVIAGASVTGTEGIAIGPDGTLYYSQPNAVGRRPPGGAADDGWVALPGASTVWGMALSPAGILYVGSPATATLYSIDTNLPAPTATSLVTSAGNPNGVTMGPDGAVYYGDFNSGSVWRVTAAGARTEVTTSAVPTANGLLFDADGTLLVLDYFDGTIFRLTLNGSMVETGRAMVASVGGGAVLDGIARDTTGRYYVTDNGAGELLRFDSSFGNQEMLLSGLPSAANIAFGKGALDCNDVYVASGGMLGRYDADATGVP